jgi:Na+/H+-dicarboxylate symporter
MRISILPKSSLGWWSVGLVVANILFFVLAQVILGSGPDYNMPLAHALTTIAVGIALAIFVTGLISIIKIKERSILVFLSTAIGLYSLIGGTISLFATLFGLSN